MDVPHARSMDLRCYWTRTRACTRVRAYARTPAHLCLIISRGDRWGLVVTFDAGGHGQNTWRSGDKIASVISFAIPFDTKIILRVAYRKRDSGELCSASDILSRRWNMYRPTIMSPSQRGLQEPRRAITRKDLWILSRGLWLLDWINTTFKILRHFAVSPCLPRRESYVPRDYKGDIST